MGGYRIEHDTMGDVRIPDGARWGASTQRAVDNFPISGRGIEPALRVALAEIKAAAAEANAELDVLDTDMAAAIAGAARDIAAGAHGDQFPVDVFQTGSGTSSNMNMNEVVAGLAAERLGRSVHPNDHVNASQSTNDVFPTAIHVAAATLVTTSLEDGLGRLAAALRRKQEEFAEVVKSGRTHLMDATPVTLGQEFGGWARSVELGAERLRSVLPRLLEVPLGGTAVGTGINAPAGFAARTIARLAERTGLAVTEAVDHFEAQGGRDALVELSGALRTIAVSLHKLVNDLRWLASGPRTGLAEIRLPDLQPGSSIMPGKVNPVIPEAVAQVVAQVVGNDAAIAFAGAAGNLELNVMMPVMARNVLESIRLLASSAALLAESCVAGVEVDEARCRAYAESSPSLGTALNSHIGYERAAQVVKESTRSGRSIREIVLERGWMTAEELDRALDVLGLTRGGVS
ncbi:MAG TPA: class II fumarate hydratase [Acidimicrobiales bacterium]|nr:class II fumarate hydratase [Acidimicrobiales bacterium]